MQWARRFITPVLIILILSIPVFAQGDLPITEDVEYTVRSGDNLDTIGATFDVDPDCIVERNADSIGDGLSLTIGDVLLISVECPFYDGLLRVDNPREVMTFVDDCEGVRIQSGDTVDLIAQENDIATAAILIENELEEGIDLEIGACLLLPDDAPAYGMAIPLRDNPPTDATLGQGGALIPGEEYVVQSGDTLDVIAQEFNVSLISLQFANNIIRTGDLVPGQILIIPDDAPEYGVYPAFDAPDFSGEIYIIQEGDTLESIAEQFNVSTLALALNNEMDTLDDIYADRAILIPEGVPEFGDDAAVLGQGGGAVEEYVVQPGDTLDVIAASFDRNTACLAEANALERMGAIYPGQVLIIDQACGRYIGPNEVPTVNESFAPASANDDTDAMSAEEAGGMSVEDMEADDADMEAEDAMDTETSDAADTTGSGGLLGAFRAMLNGEEAVPSGG